MALAAPSTIERTTNKINDELNGALTATEPNLSALAGNIKTLMAPQEQAVAGLSSAQNAAADAQNQTTEATSGTHGQAKGKVPAMGGTDKLSIAVNSSPKATFRASSPDQVEVLPSQSPTAQNRNPRTATGQHVTERSKQRHKNVLLQPMTSAVTGPPPDECMRSCNAGWRTRA